MKQITHFFMQNLHFFLKLEENNSNFKQITVLQIILSLTQHTHQVLWIYEINIWPRFNNQAYKISKYFVTVVNNFLSLMLSMVAEQTYLFYFVIHIVIFYVNKYITNGFLKKFIYHCVYFLQVSSTFLFSLHFILRFWQIRFNFFAPQLHIKK